MAVLHCLQSYPLLALVCDSAAPSGRPERRRPRVPVDAGDRAADASMRGRLSMDARSRARLGAFAQHARYDTRQTTLAARQAFARRFEREVDPDGVLPEPERARRAEAAKRAHFQRMALRSAQARRKKADG